MQTANEAEKFDEAYFSKISSAHFSSPKFKEEFGLVEKLMMPRAGDRILDVGCGKGTLGLFLLDKEKDIEIIFSDVSSEPRKYLANYNFVQCSMTDTPFGDNYFDKIFCLHVISHIKEAQKALQEMLRIAKPGGQLMIVTPNKYFVYTYRLASFFHLIPRFQFDETAQWLYGRRTLSKLLADSGWQSEVGFFGAYPSKFVRFNFLKKRLFAIAIK